MALLTSFNRTEREDLACVVILTGMRDLDRRVAHLGEQPPLLQDCLRGLCRVQRQQGLDADEQQGVRI